MPLLNRHQRIRDSDTVLVNDADYNLGLGMRRNRQAKARKKLPGKHLQQRTHGQRLDSSARHRNNLSAGRNPKPLAN